jgi:hypothetical protein
MFPFEPSPPSMETRIVLTYDKPLICITLARGDVLNRALKHARQSRNFQITPPTPGTAIRVPYIEEEPSPRDRLALLVGEKLLEILSLVPHESGHGWAQF